MALRPFSEGAQSQRHLIGLELRLVDPASGPQREVAIFPLDVEVPLGYPGWRPMFNVTLHTDMGDVTTQNVQF